MSLHSRAMRAVTSMCAVIAVLVSIAPAGASAHVRSPHRSSWTHFGHTALAINPSTASALKGLGVSVAPIAPAAPSSNGNLNFPITNPITNALRTGEIDHSGGISLTAGSTTVDLENFTINVPGQTLSADVYVDGSAYASQAPIVNLDFSYAHLGLGHEGLSLGPVGACINHAGLSALETAFGLKQGSLGDSLPLGTATVNYRLFSDFGW